MERKNCKNCAYYSAYYKQWSGRYERLNYGFCEKHNEPQIQRESCDKFKSNEQKEKSREKIRLETLEQALDTIIQTVQLLKENQNEKE